MVKYKRRVNFYDGMNPAEALKLSIAMEDAIMAEIRDHAGDCNFRGEIGWRRFIDVVGHKIGWSDEALRDRESRHRLLQLINYKLNELVELGVLMWSPRP